MIGYVLLSGVSGATYRNRGGVCRASAVDPARIGFGTYRVSNDVERHRRTLEAAVLGGISVIDTSTTW